MDHHAAGEGGRTNRLPCQKMVRAYCNGVSLGAPLPGCARWATLNWHALRNDLKNSDRRSIVKKHGKRGSSKFWSGLMVFWIFQAQISALNRGRSIKNRQTGVRSLFLREVAA